MSGVTPRGWPAPGPGADGAKGHHHPRPEAITPQRSGHHGRGTLANPSGALSPHPEEPWPTLALPTWPIRNLLEPEPLTMLPFLQTFPQARGVGSAGTALDRSIQCPFKDLPGIVMICLVIASLTWSALLSEGPLSSKLMTLASFSKPLS